MIRFLVWTICSFTHNMNGPDVQITCAVVEQFIEAYGFAPHDYDKDGDVDLRDFSEFQNGYDGESFKMPVTLYPKPVVLEQFAQGEKK